MKRRFAVLLMTAVMLLVFGSIAAEATVATRQIQVNYNNVMIYTNGKLVSVAAGQEPFLLNGVTYVPLRVAGEALNSEVNWVAETKTIYITGGTSTGTASLAAKNQEIADLKEQISDLQAKLDDEDNESDDYDLDDIRDYLLDDYDDLEDVNIDDIELDGDEDYVKVEIIVDLDDYEDEWEDLSTRDIRDWLDDLVDYIQDKITDDTVVDGMIYSADDEDLVEFYKKGDNRLEVDVINDYSGENASDVEDSLEDEIYEVDDLEFSISYIEYDDDDDIVNVKFAAEDYDCADQWDELSRTTIEDAADDIGEDIANEFEDENVKVEAVRLYFYDEDEDRLASYRYNVD